MQDLAVIACHFNWSGSTTTNQHLIDFLTDMTAQNVSVYGIELSLNNNFITQNIPNWQQIHAKRKNIAIQKSCLVNKIVSTLPDSFTKVAWLDRDITFDNTNWYNETSEKLDQYKIVQMFDTCHWQDKNGNSYQSADSCFSGYRSNTHDGFALAANRNLWNNGGLFSYAAIGSGDALITNAAKDEKNPASILAHALAYQVPNVLKFKNWEQSVRNYINKSVGVVDGNVYHKWHGSLDNRGYSTRAALLKNIIIDQHLFINNDGILEFQNVSDDFLTQIENYFSYRQEDSAG